MNAEDLLIPINEIKDTNIVIFFKGLINEELEKYKNKLIWKWKNEIYHQKINEYDIEINKYIEDNISLSDSYLFNDYILTLKNKGYHNIIINCLKNKLDELYYFKNSLLE